MNTFFFFNFNCSTYIILLDDPIKYMQNKEEKRKKKINPILNIPQIINNYSFLSINNNSKIQRWILWNVHV